MASVKEFFESELSTRIAERPSLAREVAGIFLFVISGDGGGQWTVNLKAKPGVAAGDSGDAECTLECSVDDWREIQAAPQLATQFYFEGKLRVSGDVLLATKLQPLLA